MTTNTKDLTISAGTSKYNIRFKAKGFSLIEILNELKTDESIHIRGVSYNA